MFLPTLTIQKLILLGDIYIVSPTTKSHRHHTTSWVWNPIHLPKSPAPNVLMLTSKVTSKTQISATISTKTHLDSFAVVRLDGRIDWIVTQRNALVAWTGPLLSPRPKIMRNHVSTLNPFVDIVSVLGMHEIDGSWCGCVVRQRVHPWSFSPREWRVCCSSKVPPTLTTNDNSSHLLAYTITTTTPQAHRLSALPFRIQIPSLIPSRVYQSEFFREMRSTETVQLFARVWHRIITWSRRTIIGDRVRPSWHYNWLGSCFSSSLAQG